MYLAYNRFEVLLSQSEIIPSSYDPIFGQRFYCSRSPEEFVSGRIIPLYPYYKMYGIYAWNILRRFLMKEVWKNKFKFKRK